MSKIVDSNQLKKILAQLKGSNKTIATTNGAFDLFHVGHLHSLQFAKNHADVLIVGLNSDNSVKKFKSVKRPVIPEKERAEIVANISCVDYVYIFDEDTPIDFLKLVKPNVHVKGSEYDNETLVERKIVEENNGKVIFKQREEQHSTTELIQKIVSVFGDR